MAKIYYEQDADLNLLKDKTVAIIGYGIQGRGQGLCLKDSGVNVIVSELEGTDNYRQAEEDGFKPVSAQQAAGLGDLTGAKGCSSGGVETQRAECRAVATGQSAEAPINASDQILLALVGDVLSNFGADGGHGIGTSGKSSKVTSLKSTTTVQDHANLFVSRDLARGEAAAISQHLEIAGKVGFPERNVDEITALSGIQLCHRLHHTGSQEGITLSGLLNDVRRKYLGDDDVRAKSRHD